MRLLNYILIFVLFSMPSNILAEVKIIGVSIPGLHQNDGGGVYNQIVDKIALKTGLASLKILPRAEAETNFEQCRNCCFSPANKNPEFYNFGDDIQETDPMNTSKIYVFTAKNTKPVSSLNELKGKKVGVQRNKPYGKTFDNAGLKIRNANNIRINIKRMNLGMIDAFIAHIPEAYIQFNDLELSPYPHNKLSPIAVHPDRLVCRGVSADFIKKFNATLRKMLKSGELETLLGKDFVAH